MQKPLEFVQSMSWEYRINGSQIEIKVCPFCHAEDWKFRMHSDTGLWDCKHVGRHDKKNLKGNLFTLRKGLGLTLETSSKNEQIFEVDFVHLRRVQTAHERILQNPHLLQTLMDEWCITEQTVRKWQLGYWEDANNGTAYIVIPHFVGEALYNTKFRTWFGFPKQFHRIKDASSVLLNEAVLTQPEPPKKVLLSEGEKDGIVADQCDLSKVGVDAVVGMTGGASTLSERWFDLLEGVETIYIAYDGDAAGKEGTEKLIRRLGSHRIRVVDMPDGMDIADVVKKLGPEDFLNRVRTARMPNIKSVSTLQDVYDTEITTTEVALLPTHSANLNYCLGGGTEPGMVVVVSGPPKTGKTTFTLCWALYHASLGIPTMFWCEEMKKGKLARLLASAQIGVSRKPRKFEMFAAKHFKPDVPFFLGYAGDASAELIIETFKDCYARYGITSFFFDNMHFLVRNAENKVTAIENAMKSMKNFAMSYNTHTILIAQPNVEGMKKGANMNYTNIGWSGSFGSDSDAIVLLHRDRVASTEEAFKPEMQVKVDAAREAAGGVTYVKTTSDSVLFRDMSRGEIKMMQGNA